MFEYSYAPPSGNHRPLLIAGASLGEALLVGIAVMVPLFFVDALPERGFLSAMLLPSVPSAPPPPPPVMAVKQLPRPRVTRIFDPNRLVSPVAIPNDVAVIEEAPAIDMNAAAGGVPGGLPGATAGATAGVFGNGTSMAPPLPPPLPPPVQIAVAALPPPPVVPRQVKIGGDVQAALLVKQIPPVYPLVARQGNITGKVVLLAVIATDGTIKNLTVISGHPLLVEAAMKVVPRWIYRPTILNGDPVEVITQIELRFHLGT